MRFDRNLYAESWRILRILYPYALFFVLAEYASEATLAVTGYAFSKGGELIISCFSLVFWSYLACRAHSEVLLSAPQNEQIEPKRFLVFVLLISGVFFLAIVMFFLAATLLIAWLGVILGAIFGTLHVLGWIELPDPSAINVPDMDAISANFLFTPVITLGFLLPFSLIGTVLPAYVADAGRGFGPAFRRGKRQFSWMAGQLVLGPGLVSICYMYLFFIPPLVSSWEGEQVLLYGFDKPVLNATALASVLGQVYATVMLAVALSRAYLRDEAANGEPAQDEMSPTAPVVS